MLFDLTFEDEPTMILVRDEDVADSVSEPPALPFPLLRRKAGPEPELAFPLTTVVRPVAPSALACA